MLCLVARCDADTIRFALPTRPARVGSAPDNDIVIPFSGVSRYHALAEPSDRGLLIRDSGSKNGLRVGGRRRDSVELNRESTVTLGGASLTIEDVSDSDVELAFEIEMLPPAVRGEDSARETDAAAGASRCGAGREVVRFLRDLACGDATCQPEHLLARAREALACDTVLLLLADGREGASVAAWAGQPVPDHLLDRALAIAGTHGPAAGTEPVRAIVEGSRVLAIARSERGDRAIATVYPAGGRGMEAWQREVLRYFADVALAGTPAPKSRAAENATFGTLVLPKGMVVGADPATIGLLRQVEATAGSGLDVLLLGETGTGKECFARLVHASGPSSEGPFVAVNCAAIPADLLESELFGVHGRVATGVDPRPGQIALAQGGTVFLDEVGELPEALQAKLLRFLQEREILPLGAPEPRPVDVRVIAASNRDLPAASREGGFRADLYYRLRALQYVIPPLRDRRGDIAALAVSFAGRAAVEFGRDVRGVSQAALALLSEHDWPGNVRELEAEVRRAVLLCAPGGVLGTREFGSVAFAIGERKKSAPGARGMSDPVSPASEREPTAGSLRLEDRLAAVERDTIDRALAEAKGNKSLAARLLGITRNGLAMKIARLSVDRH